MTGAEVSLRPVDATERALVAGITLLPGQETFVAPPAARLATLGPDEYGFAVMRGEAVAGFLVIDLAYAVTRPFAEPGEAGLRSMAIDAGLQGQGVARAALAALPALMAERFPEVPALLLTVNERNPRARRAYLRAGFVDTGAIYLGGSAGPQRILRMPLGR